MRQSELFTKTRREAPKDEISKNAILLIRAGFVQLLTLLQNIQTRVLEVTPSKNYSTKLFQKNSKISHFANQSCLAPNKFGYG